MRDKPAGAPHELRSQAQARTARTGARGHLTGDTLPRSGRARPRVRPEASVPAVTVQQGLGTRPTQGFLRSSGGQWVLLPKQSASEQTRPGGKVPTAAALHGGPRVPCRPCLFVLGHPRHSCLLFTSCPGSMWVPGLTASPVTGTRRHQCESLGLGVGGWPTGAPVRGRIQIWWTCRPTADLPVPPGWAGCPQVSP